jgi:hypothetical protein
MLSIFTILKPFINRHISVIQKNALSNWKHLPSRPEIIIFDNNSKVAKNEFGTPLLSDVFYQANKKCKTEYLVYANADIIFLSDFETLFLNAPKERFLMVGQRWDLDVTKKMDFSNHKTVENLRKEIRKNGELHRPAGSDYFIFRKGSFLKIPPFAVGRIGWDNWMIYEARRQKIPTIDVSKIFTVVHQNHDYSHYLKNKQTVKNNPEALNNLAIVEGKKRLFQLEDTNWTLDSGGLKKKSFNPRLVLKYLKNCPEVI